jgi:membrane protein DedA with SNARE-associated domain/membrane-associated phospholipid phosphatase
MKLIDRLFSMPLPFLNHWGYFIIFFATILEALPLIGFFIPGEMIVILGGFFAKRGMLHLSLVLIIAIIGAVLGDLIGYQLGKKYGHSFITRYGKHFFFKEEYYLKTKQLLRAHTGKTLVIGRFNSVTRAFAPFVSGTTKIKFSKFMFYNVCGGIAWGLTFTFVGYIFGTSYDIVSGYIGEVVLVAIIIAIVLAYLYKFINKRKKIFTKNHFYALIINIFSLYIFSKIVEDIIKKELISKFDIWLNAKILLIMSPMLTKAMIIVTSIMNFWGVFFLSLTVIGIMIYKKKWYNIVLYIFSIGGGALIAYSIKRIIHRIRPEDAIIHVSGYSFPSGHATVAMIFFAIVIYSFKDELKSKIGRIAYICLGIIMILLIGFSRIYLGAHWFSDVIAGFALGMFWLTLLILLFKPIISFSEKTILELKKKIESYF